MCFMKHFSFSGMVEQGLNCHWFPGRYRRGLLQLALQANARFHLQVQMEIQRLPLRNLTQKALMQNQQVKCQMKTSEICC